MLQCDLKSVLFQDISIYIKYISDYEIVKTKNMLCGTLRFFPEFPRERWQLWKLQSFVILFSEMHLAKYGLHAEFIP